VTAHLFQILANLGHARPDPPPVRLQLGLAGSSSANSAAEPLQMGPGAVEAREEVIELCQLHLQLTLSALGPLGKDVQDQPSSVHHPFPQQFLQIPLLRSGELFVQDDQVDPRTALPNLQRFALSDEIARVESIPFLQNRVGDARPGRPGELLEFGQRILGLPPRLRVPANAHQGNHLGVPTNQRVTGDG
jgi:hypothetical protein